MCGYIKLNRDFLTKLIDKPKAKLVYLTLVENAQIQEQEYNNKITLQRGDVYLSQKQISEKTSLTRQEVREALTLLLDLGIMSKNNQKTTKPTTKPTTKMTSVLTICNYDCYNEFEPSQQPSQQPQNNQDLKEIENEKEKIPHTPLKEKDKEKENIKRKRNFVVVDNAHAYTHTYAREEGNGNTTNEKEKNCGEKEKETDLHLTNLLDGSYPQRLQKILEFRLNSDEWRTFIRTQSISEQQQKDWVRDFTNDELLVRQHSDCLNDIYLLNEVTRHLINYFRKKIEITNKKNTNNTNNGKDNGIDCKNIGKTFHTQYGDTLPVVGELLSDEDFGI